MTRPEIGRPKDMHGIPAKPSRNPGHCRRLGGVGASKGVFVTTSTFSAPAVEYARGLQQRVTLIDGARRTELMVEFGVGVRLNRVVKFKRLDEDFFSDEN